MSDEAGPATLKRFGMRDRLTLGHATVPIRREQYKRHVPSWNQIASFLESMGQLQDYGGIAARTA